MSRTHTRSSAKEKLKRCASGCRTQARRSSSSTTTSRPRQVRALEEATKAHVLDRSALILDIFAQRAKTREGKLQVELAQYKYYLPRLTTWNEEMGRLGGGIGTRGPGETQLETDKRHIRARISKLQSELKEVRKIRAVQRERRMKNDVPVICLVGYTNAGKSTLLNALTGAGIPANNRLFDTLDTTSRQLTVSDTCQAILSDTVGFIAKLPHHPHRGVSGNAGGAAICRSDPARHRCVDPDRNDHIEVAERLIAQLCKPGTPVIECYNKSDVAEDRAVPPPRRRGRHLGKDRRGPAAAAGAHREGA